MKFRVLLLVLLVHFGPMFSHPSEAGEDKLAKANARLKELQVRVGKQEFANDTLRRELLLFCREQAGTPLYAKAMDALARVPAPLDKLDPATIDEEERKLISLSEMVAFIQPHQRAVAHVAFSADGTLLASSGWDNVVHVYKLGGKEPISWAKLDGSPSGIAFSPDGTLLATGCGDTRVLLWDITGEKPKQKFALAGHKNRPFPLAFSPNGKMFASGCYDPVLRIWKFDEAEPDAWAILANEKTTSLGLSSFAFSHDGKYLVAGNYIGKETLRVWDAGGNFLDEKTPPPAVARLVACSPTEPVFAFAGNAAQIHLWRLAEPRIEKVRSFAGHTGKMLPPLVKALTFSPQGKWLASTGQDHFVKLWNVETGEQKREWRLLNEGRALAFSSDGRHLAVGNSDGTLYVLRLETLTPKTK